MVIRLGEEDVDGATTYVAGTGVLLGRGSRWLLLDDAPDAAVLTDWFAMLDGPGAVTDHLLAAVERHYSDRPVPGRPVSLVLVDLAPGEERSVVRGRGAVSADGDTRLLAVGLTGDGPALPLVGGVVGAASARIAVTGRRPVPGIIDGIPAHILASVAPSAPAPADAAPPDPDRAPEPEPVGRTVARRAAPRPPEAAVPFDLDHDGHTTYRGDPDHLRQSTHETVLAAICLNGHATPTHSNACRVCGAPVPPQEPRRVPRPTLGRLVLPSGEWVALDRGVLFGRKPAPLPGGESWPHLVTLPQDSTYLSRVHLQVELDGWLVLVRDLGSRAGTTLHVPGRAPERIRANEAHVLEPGHRLDLADVYEIRFEVTP
jgi:hypothetical protein